MRQMSEFDETRKNIAEVIANAANEANRIQQLHAEAQVLLRFQAENKKRLFSVKESIFNSIKGDIPEILAGVNREVFGNTGKVDSWKTLISKHYHSENVGSGDGLPKYIDVEYSFILQGCILHIKNLGSIFIFSPNAPSELDLYKGRQLLLGSLLDSDLPLRGAPCVCESKEISLLESREDILGKTQKAVLDISVKLYREYYSDKQT